MISGIGGVSSIPDAMHFVPSAWDGEASRVIVRA
jgi:hypothetical protein